MLPRVKVRKQKSLALNLGSLTPNTVGLPYLWIPHLRSQLTVDPKDSTDRGSRGY